MKKSKLKLKIAAAVSAVLLAVSATPAMSVSVMAEPTQSVEKVRMFRLYNPNSGEHFYTANHGEQENLVSLGWNYEGRGWTAPSWSNTPVYRLYNPNAGDHHYTMNAGERDYLISLGWNDEGIGWYSDDNQEVPLYRQYNPNAVAGAHNYTTNKAENDYLKSIGWNEEGIAWYGLAHTGPDPQVLLDAVEAVRVEAENNRWRYGNSHGTPPCSDGLISCDRLICRALWDLGYTDQPAGGYGLSNHAMENYLTSLGFTSSHSWADVEKGSIVFVNKNSDPSTYEHVFVTISYDPTTKKLTRYDGGVRNRISPVIIGTNYPFAPGWDTNNILVMNP